MFFQEKSHFFRTLFLKMSKQILLKSKPAAAAKPRRSRGEAAAKPRRFQEPDFSLGIGYWRQKIDEKSRYDFGQRGRILKTPKNQEKKRKKS